MAQADLEISLFRRDAGGFSDGDGVSYGIGLRYSDPESEADKRQDGVAPVHFDPAELRQRGLDPAGYGQYLAGQLLAEPAIRGFFDQAAAATQARNLPLRLRLAINPGAAELHNLRWETLWLPGAPAPSCRARTFPSRACWAARIGGRCACARKPICARWSSWPTRPTPRASAWRR